MLCSEAVVGTATRGKPMEKRLSLEIIGTSKSIADATLIRTAISVLHDEGCDDVAVFINSVGDRESGNRYLREFCNHYRKNIAALSTACKVILKKNPLELLECPHDKCKTLAGEAPRSVAFLGEESRRHFKEVLEYLEELGIPYQLDPMIVGNRSFATETVFEIRDMREGRNMECLAAGCRYNSLGKRLGLKRETPAAGTTILLRREKSSCASRLRFRRPKVFFLQLGFEAKLKSLKVIEILRQSKIPLYQALSRDKLAAQMSAAENLKIPYSLIMGQREAIEDSVIVRDTVTRAQETVKIGDLATYFRKMKIA
jgi:histidyl-tRNA synthetase